MGLLLDDPGLEAHHLVNNIRNNAIESFYPTQRRTLDPESTDRLIQRKPFPEYSSQYLDRKMNSDMDKTFAIAFSVVSNTDTSGYKIGIVRFNGNMILK